MRQHINFQNNVIVTILPYRIKIQFIKLAHVIHKLEAHFIKRFKIERKGFLQLLKR